MGLRADHSCAQGETDIRSLCNGGRMYEPEKGWGDGGGEREAKCIIERT